MVQLIMYCMIAVISTTAIRITITTTKRIITAIIGYRKW